jgi:guanine deaminase
VGTGFYRKSNPDQGQMFRARRQVASFGSLGEIRLQSEHNSPHQVFSMIDPDVLMKRAIEACKRGIAAGQSPFGCAIALGDRVVAESHNTVVLTTDITAHAEVNALREGCREVNDIFLTDAVVATTCEPCPMCMAALHWARVGTVYYGATIADAKNTGFNELRLPAAELLRIGGSNVRLIGDLLVEECRELFAQWNSNPDRLAY